MTAATATRGETDVREIINPLPGQEEFLDGLYTYEYLLYGGAAGPGKSYILRWGAVELLLYWASLGLRNVRVGMFCETYPALRDRQVTKMEREFPAWLGEVRSSQAEGLGFYLHPKWGGGAIALRNLDDPSKYASAEFAAIFVDELTKNPRQTFDDLRFRKRWPGVEHSPFAGASNPGSIGHAWVKKLFIDRDFSGDDANIDPRGVKFIPARAGDNPHLPASYWDTLNSLPEAMRRAMLEGDWTVFAGQVFDIWRSDLHVVKPFPIPPSWTRWVAVDYGFAAPFCALWFARSPEQDRVVVYRELYATGWLAKRQALRIKAASAGDKIRMYLGDPSMWQRRRETTGDALADEYRSAGIVLAKANNDRRTGLDRVRRNLDWKRMPAKPGEAEGRLIKPPRLQVFETCPNLIRTLPALPYDEINVEDVDTKAEDHAYDALRYGLMADSYRFTSVPKPPKVSVRMEFAGR